jgi:serine/threonine protein kinase
MPMSSKLWKAITESPFPWEREALEFIRQLLPDRDPFRAWTNFEFIADDGTINEIDILLLTTVGFYLIEIKSRPGILRGDAGTWTWDCEGRLHTVDNPVIAANRKAKKLKALLERQKACRKVRLPFLEPLVFCSATNLQCLLAGNAKYRVCLRDRDATADTPARAGIIAAVVRRECDGLDPHSRGVCDRPTAKAISQAMEQAGIRPSQRARRVSDYVLEQSIAEGPGYQDWLATHVQLRNVKRRIRLYVVRSEASADDRKTIERAALREFQLLETLQHPGILRTHGFTEHQLGPALVFEHEPSSIRLDHFLAQRGEQVGLDLRLHLMRQIAEVIRFAHEKKVVHRALSPQSVLVTDSDGDSPRVKIFNWQMGYRGGRTSTSLTGKIPGTAHVDQLVDDASTAYMAPEALGEGEGTGEHLDVFSLGALAYHLFSGKPPAANALELNEKLRQGNGLQISSVLNGATSELQDLIQLSTYPEVNARCDSVTDFLDLLDDVEEKLTSPDHNLIDDPTSAQMGDKLPGGLLVKKRLGSGSCALALLIERDGQEFVLKVARDSTQNDRLCAEGDILGKLRHQNIVEFHDRLELGGLTCLLMARAGSETLGDRLRKEGRLSVDLLQRFGEELLQALGFLDDEGIAHRDIKPDNIAIAEAGSGIKRRLVVFDFSLSRTPPENIQAGTTRYLDPFLPLRKPARWDLHAERYAAAMTLYEMATGTLPKWGDGVSDPSFLDCEVTLEPEHFDSNIREQLTVFFGKALRRRPKERFDNAEEMLRAWREVFAEMDQPLTAEDTDPGTLVPARLEAATLETYVAELGLGARATNALDRVNILTVRDLLEASSWRLNRLRGVANQTRRIIAEAVKVLRERLGVAIKPAVGATVVTAAENSDDIPDSTVLSIDLLAQRILKLRSQGKGETERQVIQALLGLNPELSDSWPSQSDVARLLDVAATQIWQILDKTQERWRRDPSLTKLRGDVSEILAKAGGVMAVGELRDALLLARGSVQDEPARSQLAMAVTRAVVEVERTMAEPRYIVRRDADRVMVAATQDLADYARRLGREADKLAKEDPLVPPTRVLQKLREASLPSGVEPLSDARLVRLAVAASHDASLSSRQEVYPRGMEARRALRLSQGALVGAVRLTVDQLRQRVSGRYPEAKPLPDRLQLDVLLNADGFDFDWDPTAENGIGAYISRFRDLISVTSETTRQRRMATQEPGEPPGEVTPEVAKARQFEEKLQRALQDGAFLALTVQPKYYEDARTEFCRRFPVQQIDFEAAFLKALEEVAEKAKVKWERVLLADANVESDDWKRLMLLVQRAMPALEEQIVAARQTVLLTYAGVLGRYNQMDLFDRLRDRVGRRDGIPGLWVLIPSDEQQPLPVMDGKAVPIIGPGQRARIPESWILNRHRANGQEGAHP